MGERSKLRASDSDREHVADRLRTALTEGRLTHEEFEERLHDALSASTYGQLDPLLADLPATVSAPATPAYPAAAPKTNGLAIASMVLGVAGFLFLWGIGPLGAVISGVMAKREIRSSNGTQGGGGLATAGIALGALGLIAAIVAIGAMTGGVMIGHHYLFENAH
jgi:hypothetical protein